MLDKFLKLFGKPVSPTKPERKTRKPRISEKDQATARKEPYVKVVETKVDRNNPADGYFELDWNSYFIDDLRKAGYTGATDEEIVDKWFKALCQTVAADSEVEREIRVI
jgi:hypothetical protein